MPQTAKYYFTQAHIPRAIPAEFLAEKARSFSLTGKSFNDVHLALDEALIHALKDDLILVCGSVFLVGEVDAARLKKNK
jgi:dihydrofolate synthase/folylpolyglutamate synthase